MQFALSAMMFGRSGSTVLCVCGAQTQISLITVAYWCMKAQHTHASVFTSARRQRVNLQMNSEKDITNLCILLRQAKKGSHVHDIVWTA